MRRWSTTSRRRLDQCDVRLQDVMDYVLHNVADVSIITGFRNETEQTEMLESGRSTVAWPHSKHNRRPSLAVDFQPYPLPEREEKQWAALAYIAGRAIEYAAARGITLRWGGDWNQNGDLTDQNFDDLYHLEIEED